MAGSRRAGRVVVMGIVLLLVVAACGDDDADPERFCEISDEFVAMSVDIRRVFDLAPDNARDVVREARLLLDEAVKVAPDEIRDSAEIVADALTLLFDLLEEADFDMALVDPAEMDAALGRVESGNDLVDATYEWIEAACST